jgi:hypothetical protein
MATTPVSSSAMRLKANRLMSILDLAKRIPILSVTLTTTLRPLATFVIRKILPKGYNLQAQVRALSENFSPFAILLSIPFFQGKLDFIYPVNPDVRLRYQYSYRMGKITQLATNGIFMVAGKTTDNGFKINR